DDRGGGDPPGGFCRPRDFGGRAAAVAGGRGLSCGPVEDFAAGAHGARVVLPGRGVVPGTIVAAILARAFLPALLGLPRLIEGALQLVEVDIRAVHGY